MSAPKKSRPSIRCDQHPERVAVRYRVSDQSRACADCLIQQRKASSE